MNGVEVNCCPCCDTGLRSTEVRHFVWDILRKWEAHGVAFSEETWADYPENRELELFSCPNCGFGVFLPMLTGTDAFYIDVTRNEYYLADRWDFHVAIKLLRASGAGSVLDVGCGQGAFLARVKQSLPKVSCSGNDANPAVRSCLPQGVPLYTSLGNVPDGLDAVTLFQVIEHVAEPEQMLADAVTKLRPGGMVIVSVPDHSGPIRFFSDSHTAIPPHHVTQWTPASLEALFSKLGLKIIARKREPLPDYLMPFYLHKIIANSLGCMGDPVREAQIREKLTDPIIRFCQRLGIKSLPVRGHTYLIAGTR